MGPVGDLSNPEVQERLTRLASKPSLPSKRGALLDDRRELPLGELRLELKQQQERLSVKSTESRQRDGRLNDLVEI